ncbi:bifunctional folylpolyglutamate synthase/dihydrofolate synthase [Christiangramia aquimixticola]|uniref:bifunctional folylpolyglutamate synthase/dihydrofolate synthase n=1 Tax=Christiangramia aquimixticola TaxID=1697558 RepID=UPI003AA99C29
MFQQLPMYQSVGKTAYKKDLSNTLKLSAHLGDPHASFKSVHIAGTNGKGSVSHMLASVFQAAGYKTGLYTSPHLKDFRERIRINGEVIPEENVVDFIRNNKKFLEANQLSFFEMSVGMAFDYFAKEKVDIAIIETGLGGRLDSTNIIQPELSVITNIGLDHTAFLGNTLELIATEKAGIIKNAIPVVIGEKQPETEGVFKNIAQDNHSSIVFADDLKFETCESDLKGDYQEKNIKTVLAAINLLKDQGWSITDDQLKAGLNLVKKNTGLRGRWDILQDSPKVICDTAHNKEGLRYVLTQLKRESFQHLHIVLGVVNDKDLNSILPLFPKNATYYFAKPDVPRGLEADLLAAEAAKHELYGEIFPSVSSALNTALNSSNANDLIFVGGSTFTVAEVI